MGEFAGACLEKLLGVFGGAGDGGGGAARERRSVNYRDTVEAPALRVADEPAKKERNGTE